MTDAPDTAFDSFPCSFGQQRLWLLSQLAPESPFYNIHAAIRSPGRLRPEPLAAAAAALTGRHETLRTAIVWNGEEPVQQVWASCAPRLRMLDLSQIAPADAEATLREVAQAEAAEPFDLARPPLLRLGLVLLPGGESVLLVTIHHIVADSWSMSILLRDLWTFYAAAAEGRPAELPPLAIQYADFAAWQRSTIAGERREALLGYWRDRLAGASALDLPTDFARRATPSHRGGLVPFNLPRALSDRLLGLSRALGVTPYVLLTTAFAEVLHRYSGSDEVVLGAPMAGRDGRELEDLVGFFVNSVVLRLDLGGEPTFREAVARTGAALAEAMAHQDLPFEQVVEAVAPHRDLSHNPIFQVTCQFLASPLESAATAGDGTASLVDVHRGYANFELSLDLWLREGALEGRLEYALDLYAPETAERLIGHLQTLLQAAAVAPEQRIGRLEMLTPQERAQVLGAWSQGRAAPQAERSIPQVFAEMVARHGEAAAIRTADGDLSYVELDRRSTALARRLAAAGVQRGDRVALALPRGEAQIIAALAILKAGAAYVAVDPAWPAERGAHVLHDAGVRIAIGDGMGAHAVTVVALEGPDAPEAALPAGSASDIAYIAFSSGSTGRPKGVPALHRGVVRLMRGGPPVAFEPGDVMLAYAPLGFDASTLEIWGPLLNGAAVAPAPPRPLSPHEIAELMVERGVTCAWLTAGLFDQVSGARPDVLAGLRILFAGGDVLPPAAVRRVLLAGGRVVNGYGPTENTTFTCCYDMRGASAADAGVLIGRPVAGTYVYVLDQAGRPVPVGTPGELVAGGAGVSPGYLGGDAGGRFTPDPLDPARGQVYWTGDVVRWRPGGDLEFLGRRDRQVKVRGFRIELGDIETQVSRHPDVQACVAAVRGEAAADKSLVAFVVLRPDAAGLEALRRDLAAQLPAYMVPSAIVAVEALPLGENGKVDVAALLRGPLPADVLEGADPEGELQALVAAAMAEVLGLPAIPADQDFFALGGHSLHATRVVTRLREALSVRLPLQTIFERPTVRGLAAALEDLLLAEFDSAMEAAE